MQSFCIDACSEVKSSVNKSETKYSSLAEVDIALVIVEGAAIFGRRNSHTWSSQEATVCKGRDARSAHVQAGGVHWAYCLT